MNCKECKNFRPKEKLNRIEDGAVTLEEHEDKVLICAKDPEFDDDPWFVAGINKKTGKLMLFEDIGENSDLCLDEKGRIVIED